MYAHTGVDWSSVVAVSFKQAGDWVAIPTIYFKQSGDWVPVFASGFTYSETISVAVDRYNVAAKAITAGWDGSTPLNANITIAANVYSSIQSTPAFICPELPATSQINIQINANRGIIGKGGNAGVGGTNSSSPTVGTDGGTALYTRYNLTINNLGVIAGGGGGGGGGAWNRVTTTESVCIVTSEGDTICTDEAITRNHGGGGGGGGSGFTGGQGSGGAGGGGTSGYTGSSGAAGTNTAGGNGGGGGPLAGDGGNGGARGQDGQSGQSTDDQAGRVGGVSGFAINGNSYITWTTVGTLLGRTQ